MPLKNATSIILCFVCLLCIACTAYRTPPVRSGGVYHKVQEGETLHSIAKAYKVDVHTLISANRIKDPSQVGVRSVIFIPDVSRTVKVPKTTEKAAGIYHHVKEGDTLYSIAKAYKVDVPILMSANGIKDPSQVGSHSVIFIPDVSERVKLPQPPKKPAGIYHRVRKGETLYSIAKVHGIDVRKLSAANNIVDPTSIEVDRILHIPDTKTQPQAVPTGNAARPAPRSTTTETASSQVPADNSKRYVRRAPKSSSQFVWPAKGKIVSKFGVQPDGFTKYNGITIEVKQGTPVVASEDGRVDRSGRLKFFGTTIIIKHAKYWTVYANLEKSMVMPNDIVRKGQQIALSGKQEGSGKPCLYFEIRDKRYKPKNPLFYLPR